MAKFDTGPCGNFIVATVGGKVFFLGQEVQELPEDINRYEMVGQGPGRKVIKNLSMRWTGSPGLTVEVQTIQLRNQASCEEWKDARNSVGKVRVRMVE